jgi:aryl-alcohol dehydrogenase-like predicted oxidoreductase
MALPASSRFQFTADLSICRILNGLWQVSGGHGYIEPARALTEMIAYHNAGFTTWDLADHYGPAEDFIGAFRGALAASHGAEQVSEIQAFTKWVPQPGRMSRRIVEDAIGISLLRMGVKSLDLLQFHWWDYAYTGYLDALKHLSDLREEGKIRHLALTNFDTERLEVIADHGIRIVSNQVQYSMVDRRPEARMVRFCRDHAITLLTYGTVLGGLLSAKYLGQPEPRPSELNTASLRKYKNVVDAWGGWPLLQRLLAALNEIAIKHHVSISNVGVRYILDRPAVAGVIVGARLGITQHLADNAKVFGLALDAGDHEIIEAVLANGRDLINLIGDCGDEYR